MIDSGYFFIFWFFGTLYMFMRGGWVGFGEGHPRIAMFIIVLGGPIVSALISE